MMKAGPFLLHWLLMGALTCASAAKTEKPFWSFQKVQRPEIPTVQNTSWVKNPIDAFILHQLEAKGLHPVSRASKAALIRRAYYDLIGLPPTPQNVEAFLADESPEAFTNVIEELLNSPHYGEQWARHWFDCVRYGESNSYEEDSPKPEIWRYRDYVISSFNNDKPYDQFIREQLAGDELDRVTPKTIAATGYYRLGIWDSSPTDPVQAKYDELDDILATTSQVFLGLTINCARCHDHKLDPIPQKDYYRMLAFFHNIRNTEGNHESILTEIANDEDRRQREKEVRALESRLAELQKQISATESIILRAAQGENSIEETNPERRAKLLAEYIDEVLTSQEKKIYGQAQRDLAQAKQTKMPPWPKALSVKEHGATPPDTFVLLRGSIHNQGDLVEPGFISVLNAPQPSIPTPPSGASSSGRRKVLADWIASPENPLTARVMANRLWHYHFGRGLVKSPNNFGYAGDAPTHPELLDWLATELVATGWSLKAMHRLIMSSRTYQMASTDQADNHRLDPDNHLWWRMNMRRLTAEQIRDSILAVNGSLNLQLGGPSIYSKLADEVLATQSRPGQNWGNSSPEDRNRRSLYIHVKRSLLDPLLTVFDWADPDTSCPVRFSTTQPTQALTLLNSDFISEQAARFAARLRDEAGADTRKQVHHALHLALGREPHPKEVQRGWQLIRDLTEVENMSPDQALQQYCLVVFNLNEFVFLD